MADRQRIVSLRYRVQVALDEPAFWDDELMGFAAIVLGLEGMGRHLDSVKPSFWPLDRLRPTRYAQPQM